MVLEVSTTVTMKSKGGDISVVGRLKKCNLMVLVTVAMVAMDLGVG